jgi:hypothetical protein
MSKSNITEMEQELGSIVQQFIYRLPKKNHEAMVQLEKQFIQIFRNYDGMRFEVFQLSSTENMMDWTNIAPKLYRPVKTRRFGWSKSSTETASTEMNTWQSVEMMKI